MKDCETYEPAPSRSLNSSRGRVELLPEVLKTSISLFEGSFKRSIAKSGLRTSSRGKILPEQGVIDMP